MADLQKLVDDLSALTVLEAAELSKLLEEKWGVSAAAPMAFAGAMPAGGGDGHRRGGGDAPLFFQQLGELGSFQNGQGREVFDQLFKFRHGIGSFEVSLCVLGR